MLHVRLGLGPDPVQNGPDLQHQSWPRSETLWRIYIFYIVALTIVRIRIWYILVNLQPIMDQLVLIIFTTFLRGQSLTWRNEENKFYSVIQSDGNSLCGDVVSDSFNKTFRYKDNILDQICKSKYVRIIIMTILILYNITRKCILTLQ